TCGGSMVPRTYTNRTPGSTREIYYCYGRAKEPKCCSMPNISRTDIDLSVLSYFEQVGLDLEATRDQLAAAVDQRADELRVLLSAARIEAQEASASLARVKRDYTKGDLSASEWREFRDELSPQRDAAEAAVARLESQLAEVGVPLAEAEEEMIRHLADIRAAVAGEIKDADSVAAVRAALTRLFDSFVIHNGAPETAHVELVGERWIEPVVSNRTVDGYDEKIEPVLSGDPVIAAASGAENNYAMGFVR
ncbi:MAG TPA: recombinase zinc beta ribbon domain-containing protein, partial [Solirubrobacterales bacterium]